MREKIYFEYSRTVLEPRREQLEWSNEKNNRVPVYDCLYIPTFLKFYWERTLLSSNCHYSETHEGERKLTWNSSRSRSIHDIWSKLAFLFMLSRISFCLGDDEDGHFPFVLSPRSVRDRPLELYLRKTKVRTEQHKTVTNTDTHIFPDKVENDSLELVVQ